MERVPAIVDRSVLDDSRRSSPSAEVAKAGSWKADCAHRLHRGGMIAVALRLLMAGVDADSRGAED